MANCSSAELWKSPCAREGCRATVWKIPLGSGHCESTAHLSIEGWHLRGRSCRRLNRQSSSFLGEAATPAPGATNWYHRAPTRACAGGPGARDGGLRACAGEPLKPRRDVWSQAFAKCSGSCGREVEIVALPVCHGTWAVGESIFTNGAWHKVFCIQAIQDTWDSPGPLREQIGQLLSQDPAGVARALCRGKGDCWNASLMTKRVELRYVLNDSGRVSAHAHIVGTRHDYHEVDGAIFKHAYKTSPVWPNCCPHRLRGSLVQHVLRGEAAQATHCNLAWAASICKLSN